MPRLLVKVKRFTSRPSIVPKCSQRIVMECPRNQPAQPGGLQVNSRWSKRSENHRIAPEAEPRMLEPERRLLEPERPFLAPERPFLAPERPFLEPERPFLEP